ncbi:uncharacterized protein Dvar_73550 [Desulfosarcina variabilis str. Montpellier]|uniref:DUF1186 domain-containing protein n=1 Tax=Desulfosarcina variabilis TaxID=2300 RepID=UPI003AFAF003
MSVDFLDVNNECGTAQGNRIWGDCFGPKRWVTLKNKEKMTKTKIQMSIEGCRYDVRFWGLLAIAAYGLYTKEIMDIIQQVYADELIAPGMVHYSDFEEALERDKDNCLEKLKFDMERKQAKALKKKNRR